MRVGFIENMMPFAERKHAYAADVTYGTNSEFGFDYLRDNMAVSLDSVVQRSHAYAIVDEVDSILVDEARTPLIISGEPETAAEIYYDFARVAKTLRGHPADETSRRASSPTPTSSTTRSARPSRRCSARIDDGRARAPGREPLRPAERRSSSTT